jgi:hypothetical protein
VRRSWRAALIGCGVAPVALVGIVAGPASPVHAIGGLDTSATTTYTIDFAAGVVRGRIEFAFVNSFVDDPATEEVEETAFTGYQFALPGDATNVAATSAAGPVTIAVAPVDQFLLATIDFGTSLEFLQRLDLAVTFDLPGYAPRTAAPGRANRAFVSFVAWGIGDPGRATVRIVAPTAADVAMPSLDDGTGAYSRPQVVTRGKSTVHTFRAIPEPEQFGLFVAAADDTKLLQRQVSVAGQDVVIQAWPDDRRWSRFVTRQVRRGLPALAELVGRPARDQQSVYVRESARPGLEGYSGWYDYESGVIEVGEQLDPAVTLHELAHGWFNDDTSFHRWITEGLAEAYANVVIERNGGTPREPERPRPNTPGRQPLNEWEDFDFSRQNQDTETYGYAASYFVIDALLDEIGIERMAAVLDAVDEASAVYADAEPSRPGPVGWRRFLDLLEEVGGSEQATQLFRRFVLLPAEAGELDPRAEGRRQYEAFLADNTGWAPPAGIGSAMEQWEFADAVALIDAAGRALSARDDFTEAAAGTGVELPAGLQTRFEEATSPDALDLVGEEIAELEETLGVVLATEQAAQVERSTLAQLGLGHDDFATDLAGAREAISAGDPAGAEELVAEVRSALAVAEPVGERRAAALADSAANRLGLVAVAAAAGLVLAGLLALAARHRRRHRGSGGRSDSDGGSGDVAADLDPSSDTPVDGNVQAGVGDGVELDEDALAGAGLGGVDGGLDVANGDAGEGTGPAGVVERGAGVGDVGDPVLELGEDVGAVVDAQPVARTEVLVDPDTHGGTER